MLQGELYEAVLEFDKEIQGEMNRMVREAEEGRLFDAMRYGSLASESLMLTALAAVSSGLGECHDGPLAEVSHAR